MSIRSDAQADGNNQVLDFAVGTGNRASGNLVASIAGVIPSGATAGGTLKGYLSFSTNSGDSLTETFKITEDGNVSIPADSKNLLIGAGGDLELNHDGTYNNIHSNNGELHIKDVDGGYWIRNEVNGCLLYTSPSPRD